MTLLANVLLVANLILPHASAAPPQKTVPPPETGEVTFYAPPETIGRSSLMLRVWNWRIWMGHVPECPECVDAIALVDPEHIGQKVWLRSPSGEVVGPLMVVDCAEAKHRANLRKRGWVADISWELGMRWRMAAGLKGVTVLFEKPAHVDVTTPINRPTSCPQATGCTKTKAQG